MFFVTYSFRVSEVGANFLLGHMGLTVENAVGVTEDTAIQDPPFLSAGGPSAVTTFEGLL